MTDYNVVKYHDGDQSRTALAWHGGRTLLHLVMQTDQGIAKVSVPMSEQRYCRPIKYDVTRAVKLLRSIGRRAGITAGAKAILDAAISGEETR